jgi:hypothetical protein
MALSDGVAVIGASIPGISIGRLQAGALAASVAGIGGGILGRAAMRYAATGGEITKGVFVWYGVDPATGQPGWVPFTFPINPEELNQSWAPKYAALEIPGQNDPRYQFVHGGEKTLSFSLHFFYLPQKVGYITGTVELLTQLVTRLPVGVDTTNAMPAPPAVYLSYGKHIQGTRYIVSKMDVKCFDLFDPAYLLPMRAEVQFELKVAPAPTERPDSLVRGANHGKLTSIFQAAF